MEIKALKQRISLRIIVYIIVLGVAISLCIYLGGIKENSYYTLSKLKNDISSLQRKMAGLSQQAIEFNEAVAVWESLDERSRAMQGLRINNAKDLMDELEERYYLSDVSVTFSKPENIKDAYITNTTSVVASDVSIKLSAISDAHIYNFIDALINEYPGYIQIKSFSATRKNLVTKELLKEIAFGNKPALVEGKLDIVWRGLLYNGPVVEGAL